MKFPKSGGGEFMTGPPSNAQHGILNPNNEYPGRAAMTRSALILALVTSACVTSALAQTSSPPRNDLPQLYRTTHDWGELPAGMKWAAVTSIEAAADGSSFVAIFSSISITYMDEGLQGQKSRRSVRQVDSIRLRGVVLRRRM
jgi:hypothetical protein